MTVQELIDQLTELKNEGFGETQLVLSVSDHTDFTYHFDFPGFDVGPVYDESYDWENEDSGFPCEDEEGEELDYVVCEVSI